MLTARLQPAYRLPSSKALERRPMTTSQLAKVDQRSLSASVRGRAPQTSAMLQDPPSPSSAPPRIDRNTPGARCICDRPAYARTRMLLRSRCARRLPTVCLPPACRLRRRLPACCGRHQKTPSAPTACAACNLPPPDFRLTVCRRSQHRRGQGSYGRLGRWAWIKAARPGWPRRRLVIMSTMNLREYHIYYY